MFSCFPNKPGNNIFSLDHWVLYKREQRIQATISMMDWLSARTSRPNIDFILQWTPRTNKYIFLPNNVSYYPWLAQRSGRIVLPSWHFYPSVRILWKPAIIFTQTPQLVSDLIKSSQRANIKRMNQLSASRLILALFCWGMLASSHHCWQGHTSTMIILCITRYLLAASGGGQFNNNK